MTTNRILLVHLFARQILTSLAAELMNQTEETPEAIQAYRQRWWDVLDVWEENLNFVADGLEQNDMTPEFAADLRVLSKRVRECRDFEVEPLEAFIAITKPIAQEGA